MTRKRLDIQDIADDLSASRFFQPAVQSGPVSNTAPAEAAATVLPSAAVSELGGTMETRNHSSTETRKRGAVDPPLVGPGQATAEIEVASAADLFDIAKAVDDKRTVDLRTEEIEALDDWKRELRRKYRLKITQYNLVRCALHELWQDYQQHGDASIVVRRLRELQK